MPCSCDVYLLQFNTHFTVAEPMTGSEMQVCRSNVAEVILCDVFTMALLSRILVSPAPTIPVCRNYREAV